MVQTAAGRGQVGTPGRVNDMAGKGHLRLDDCLIFVLDEARSPGAEGLWAYSQHQVGKP